ncbi:5-(carboxyamino)imidazole ribonucleotide synthase [Pseudaeromonas sharmana]|uniref:N5-carboxyaminoimidazole ribonucleotide synthase n=1 Tax=Pseudaeromonas sharmana TaxID=328412 RepID=A0ABV8CRC9_9GAMM
MNVLILGGGQLARMLILAAAPLGIRCQVVDPAAESCAADLAPWHRMAWDEVLVRRDLLDWADVITYESESVPCALLTALATQHKVAPSAEALQLSGDRWHEKQWLSRLGVPVAPHRCIDSLADLQAATAELGFPCFLKWRQQGYDGKGQWRLNAHSDLASIWQAAQQRPSILEAGIAFTREVSLIASRRAGGELVCYPLTENRHQQGILIHSRPLADDPLQAAAEAHARRLMQAVDYVGTLAIEFFVVDEQLMANEVAPRVHNSGHWTIEGAETSQFANHLRAICDWPLGSTRLLAPTLMLNLIGQWPSEALTLAERGAHLHLYGKAPRPGRKVGHLTLRARSEGELMSHWLRLQPLLPRSEQPSSSE